MGGIKHLVQGGLGWGMEFLLLYSTSPQIKREPKKKRKRKKKREKKKIVKIKITNMTNGV